MFGRPEAAAVARTTALERDLAAFFAEHYDRLVRLAALVCHSQSLTEDAVQAAMEQAWRRRSTLRDRAQVRPWMDRIVVREAIRTNRRPWWTKLTPGQATVTEISAGEIEGDGDDASSRPGPSQRAMDPIWVALTVAFHDLPVEQRAVVALHLYAGYSVEETAQIMGARLETTRSRLRLARDRLRRELGSDEQ